MTPFAPVQDDQGAIEAAADEETGEVLAQISHDIDQPTNQTIFDSNTSQRLSQAEIHELRDSGKCVVTELIQNSASFDQKNSFSKVKYIQRKQKKFSRWIRVLDVNSRTLSNHMIEREPSKILDLRLDTLGQVLNLANVQFGGKYLLMDDTKGLLMGAVIERSVPVDGRKGTEILVLHEDVQFQPNLLKMFNFSSAQLDNLLDIHLRDCIPEKIEAQEWTNDQTDPQKLELYADKIESRRLKFVERQKRRLDARAAFDAQNFTSIILAVDPEVYTCESLVTSLTHLLQPGGILVAYSTSKEALSAAFYEALTGTKFNDVKLTESFLRPYQTAEGRMHPEMTCNGHGGFILSMTRVE